MLALVLVVGHFILTRLGIAYRAVTNFYSTGGKSPACDDDSGDQGSDSYRKSRHKSVAQSGIGSASQAYMRSGATLGQPTETKSGLPSTMTMQTEGAKKSKAATMQAQQSQGATIAASGYPPTATAASGYPPTTMAASGYPLTATAASGYPPTATEASGYPGSGIMDPQQSRILPPQEDPCGPEISPSRMVTGPLPAECQQTSAWRTSRHSRGPPMSNYMTEAEGETMSTGYIGQQRTMASGYTGAGAGAGAGAGYVGQQRSSYGAATQASGFYGGMSHHSAVTGATAYDQSRMSGARTMRQNTAMMAQSVGAMSQASQAPSTGNGELLKKMKVQFRPSKIPSAYRFPRPDDIPCSNEDYPPGQGQPQQQQRVGFGSGSHLTSYTTTTTPRASPPRSISPQRPPTAFSRVPSTQTAGYTGYMEEDIDEVVSMATGYTAQLGGVSGASGAYQTAENTGIPSMPQAPTTIGYEPSFQPTTYQPQPQSTGYQTQAPSRSAFATIPPSQSAYSTGKSGYQSDGGASRITSARSATTKNCKPIPAYNCGKATGFDDGPLPRPPKRKAMSAADDFSVPPSQSRASSKRSQQLQGSETPSSTISPEIEFLSTSISQMPQSGTRTVAPTSMSRPTMPGGVMSTAARSQHTARSADMHVSGVSSPQKNKSRHSSGLYSLHASGIRSVSEQDVQQSAMTAPHYVTTSLSRAGTATPSQSPRRSPRTAVLEMDCTNTDQYNDF